jgi:hypothetical protein
MAPYNFDDRHIQWHKLGDFEHFVYSVLDIDRENKIVDVIFKFEPHKPIILHRHRALNKTLVIQGEHRLYEPNGYLKEVRPIGSYTTSPANPDPHRECGGDDGAVVLFSIRGSDGVFYEVLDDQQNIIGTLSMQDFIDLFEANKK